MTVRPHSPASARNREAILSVLGIEFSDRQSVLEIGSGTGQHAVWFTAQLTWLRWQTSDLVDNHPGINAWIDFAGGDTVLRPLAMDVRQPPRFERYYDAVFSANTAHIMGIDAVEAMFGVAGEVLRQSGLFCLYGPFREGGEFDTESNRDFDESLRMRDESMGIRDLEALDRFAGSSGMTHLRRYAMPANNQMHIWQKTPKLSEGG